jgi:hypothetical protein
MTADQHIDYEDLTQTAMRGVVRTILARIVKSGLPGEHHFYIAFNTDASGVVISKRLKEKYPQEMTVVLQHRFWDLTVNEDRFAVRLTFDGIAERLVVPFAAIKLFFDPSVPYGLQFEDSAVARDAPQEVSEASTVETGPTAIGANGANSEKRPRTPRRPRADKPAREQREGQDNPAPTRQPAPGLPKPADATNENKVVSLDAFRRK